MTTTMPILSRWRASAASQTNEAWSAEALQECFLSDVFRYVSRRLPGRAEAEDITAETFAAAFSASYLQADPLPYLLGIARRKLIDRARKRKRQP
jgi:DNA-directed RNA polymerase specialized sigma24 family protein